MSFAALGATVLVLAVCDPLRAAGTLARRRLAHGARLDGSLRLGHGARLGRGLRRALAVAGRRLSGGAVEQPDEALVGAAALVAALAAVLLGPVGALAALAAAVTAVAGRQRRRRLERVAQIERGLPEVIDLLGLVVGAGRLGASALSDICPRVAEPFRSELSEVLARAAAGAPFVDSVTRLRDSLGPSVASVVYAITAAETDGAPLQPALERAADEAHRRRRVRAEEAARRVPVLMLFPLVFCVLPAFCLLTVVPLLLGAVGDLQLPP